MKSRIFTLFILFTTIITNAQLPVAGTLDTNFGTNGSVFPPDQYYLYPFNISVQPQTGEIVTAGMHSFATENKSVGFIGRYDFYGNPKANFGTNGILEIANLSPTYQAVHKAYFESSSPESAIYIKGNCRINGKITNYISKYSSNGILDTSYGTNGSIIDLRAEIHGDYIYSIEENPITNHQTFRRYHLADGTLDQNFNNGDLPFLISETTFYTSYFDNINIQPDGKIVLCGKSGATGIIARYDNTGHIDTNFATNGYYYTDNTEIKDVYYTITQSDGKIIFLTNGSSNRNNAISILGRLNVNGALDTTYGISGYFKHDFQSQGFYINNLRIQSDNKVLMCGQVNDGQQKSFLFTARISETGFLDFWRNDLESVMSENYSIALIKDSYLFSFGYVHPNGSMRNAHPVIQKIHLKSPEISLNGTSLPSETTDLDLITTDGISYSKNDVVLAAGAIKFRLDHSDACYWGAATTNSFPEGVSNMGGNTITINDSGTYNVSFNIKTGAYNFINKATLGTVDQNIDSTKFTFYPNPAKEKVTFTQKLKSIRVYTSDGKLMSSTLINNEINISSFSKGVYYFQAVTENNSIIGNKFIKD